MVNINNVYVVMCYIAHMIFNGNYRIVSHAQTLFVRMLIATHYKHCEGLVQLNFDN